MKAAVVAAPGRVEIVDVPIPEPDAHEVRVRIEGCGVCASNIPPWEGREWFQYPMEPGRLGHEAWGSVDAVGAEVHDLPIGTRVALLSNHAYAEYDKAARSSVIPLPEQLDGKPFPGEPLGCAMNIVRRARITQGESVAIVGIGFLGALLTQRLSRAGTPVVAFSRKPEVRELARAMGAVETVDMSDYWAALEEGKRLSGGRGFDVVIEAVGKQSPLDLASELTREMGRLVIAGYHQDGLRNVNMQLWNWRGLEVSNAHEREETVYVRGVAEAAEAVVAGTLDPSSLYTDRMPLEELATALDRTRDRPPGFMKALIDFK